MTGRSVLKYGFAIFAMFFGSGNLVFPLQIGLAGGSHWIAGFFGLFLTGIALPFCGLFVIKLHKGNYRAFFNEAGSIARIILPFFTLSLLGCFGVVPRCIAVAHGGLNYLASDLSLFSFSAIFCGLTYVLSLKDQVMVNVLGKWMSPILLVALVLLIGISFWNAPLAQTGPGANQAFSVGFLTGYQTMDLFAAFFFSALIFQQIQSSFPANTDEGTILKFAIIPSLIGSALLSIIYFGFVFLGSHYSSLIAGTDPEMMLPIIVMNSMGSQAVLVIAIAMIFSCLTTAVALNNIYTRYLCSTFNFKERAYPWILLLTTCIAFTISLLDFRGIAQFLAPVLEVSYPGLIALTMMAIWVRKPHKSKMAIFWVITLSFIFYNLLAI